MNSFLNIQIRVIAAQAQKILAQVQRQMGGLSMSGATASAAGFGSAWRRLGLAQMGSQMQWLGRQIEYNFTLPLALAGAAVVKMSMDNEKAFTRIAKVYGDASHGASAYNAELQSLRRAFVALSNQFGIAQSDALNIAADWAAAGASGLALAKSVQLTMKAMVLGELDAATATQSLIAIQAQYGLSIDQLAGTLETLNMVENQTGISMGGLILGFARAAGVARSAGVSARFLAADLAALTPAAGSAVNAGNALKTIFSRMLSPGTEAAAVMKKMGINTQSFAWQSANAQDKLLVMARSFNNLSDAQKGFVSSIIASRYQVNRFEVLMRDLVDANGYYLKSLNSTSDQSKVFAQAQKELNLVLTSSPQRLKILWTMIQNAMVNIIQPLIPMILWLAQVLQRAVTAFSELNPGVQKFVLFSLVLLAVVGPVVRYFGAVQVLLFELIRGFKLLLLPIYAVRGALVFLLKTPLKVLYESYVFVMRGMLVASIVTARALPGIFGAAGAAIKATWRATWFAINGFGFMGVGFFGYLMKELVRKVGPAIVGITRLFALLVTAWRLVVNNIINITVYGWPYIATLWRMGIASLMAVQTGFIGFVTRTWAIATAAPLLFTRAMWTGIISSFTRILPTLRLLASAIFTAMTGPWGAAVAAIILVIVLFWDQLKQIWKNIVNWVSSNTEQIGKAFAPLGRAAGAVRNVVMRAFNALPEGIRNAMLAVVRVIAAAARKVYEFFSYINPWARHSPSLVDNVTTGVAEIARQFASLTNVGSVFASAADDLDIFAEATKRVNRSAEANHYAEIRKQLIALASDAVPAFNRLVKELYALEDQLRASKKAVDAQEAVVNNFKNALDAANNELSVQKDILQKMKDEADAYQEVINRINGDLEVLKGSREALRQAGAGSDILGQFDAQIQALKDQKSGINDQLDAAKRAYESQKQLVEQLTASRDALQRSYDDEKKKLDELQNSYQKIQDRIRDITGAIQDFASSVEQLKSSGKGSADLFAAGAGANFPPVSGKGSIGREGPLGDQSKEIDKFTQGIADQTKNMFGLFDFLEPVKKAWNKAKEWLGKNVAPAFGVIGDGISAAFSNLPNPFENVDFSGFIDTLRSVKDTVLGFFESIWKLIGPPLREIKKIITDAFGRAVSEIGPELSKFKDLLGPIGDLFKVIWTVAKPLAMVVGGILLLAIKVVAEVLAHTLKPVLDWLIDVIKGVIKVFRGLIEFLTGVFTGNWKLAWKGIQDFLGGTWDVIWSTIKNAGLLIWGAVQGLVEGVVGFFTWLWDELVGHSIIPDIVNGIIFWFKLLWKVVETIWDALLTALKWAWDNILLPVFRAFGQAIDGLKTVAAKVFDWMRTGWNSFVDVIQVAKAKAIAFVAELIVKFFALIDFLKGLKAKVDTAIKGLWDGLVSTFKGAVNALISMWNKLDFSIDINVPDWVPIVGGKQFHIADIFPDIPLLARGGTIANKAMAVVGEGRKGYPEYVIPTDPMYRRRALRLFGELGSQLGDTPGYGVQAQSSTRSSGEGTNNYFYGDLVFPNIKDGDDAEEFIKNLRALAGS